MNERKVDTVCEVTNSNQLLYMMCENLHYPLRNESPVNKQRKIRKFILHYRHLLSQCELFLNSNFNVFATMDGILVFILVKIDLETEQTDRYPK